MGHTTLTVLCLERHLSRLVQDPQDDREESRCLLAAGGDSAGPSRKPEPYPSVLCQGLRQARIWKPGCVGLG